MYCCTAVPGRQGAHSGLKHREHATCIISMLSSKCAPAVWAMHTPSCPACLDTWSTHVRHVIMLTHTHIWC